MPVRTFSSNDRNSHARTRRRARESVNKRDGFLNRLRKVGATDDEVGDFAAIWDDPAGWGIPRDVLTRLSDGDLRQLLEHNRREFREHTTTVEEEQDAQRATADRVARDAWTVDHPTTVTQVMGWVGADPHRAAVALDVELDKPADERRKTLIAQLEPLVEQLATSEQPPIEPGGVVL